MTDAGNSKPQAPVRRGTERQRAYETLKSAILNGVLQRGERLSEVRVMRDFDLGRTPLREAFNRLEREGLVASEPNIGYSVANLDIDDVCDLLIVREGLDGIAAEIAATVATPADLDRLRAVMAEIEALATRTQRDAETYARELELGLLVHEMILEITGNRALSEFSERVYDQLRLALWLEVRWIDVSADTVTEHRAIIDALIARDPVAAAQAARAHVRSSRDNMQTLKKVHDLRRSDGRRLPVSKGKA